MRGIRNSEESIVIKENKNRRKVWGKIRREKDVERIREYGTEENKEGPIWDKSIERKKMKKD